MPGIAGIIGKIPQEIGEKNIGSMLQILMHETFYKKNTYANEQIGIYAGCVCHEGSFADCMPVWNEKKDMVLFFFGENFVDKELFNHLKAKHHKFDNFNASYIIHLYEEKGINFLCDMNGWFSGLLVDLQNTKIILFNDRYGMQRIYYHEGKDAFYFSSEAKALLRICPELRKIDIRGFGEYLSCECVLDYRTIFENIFLLPGASVWSFQPNGSISKKSFFNPEIWENQPWLEKEFFYERLKETFQKILPRYFRSNQEIGISLTGGLDTRMIMSNMIMQKDKYPCYSFGGMYRDSADVRIAREVAKESHQSHKTLYLDTQFLSDFPNYAEKTVFITDGCLDVSMSPEIYLNKQAREISPIRMTGNYGGEVLRGIEGKLKAREPRENLYSNDLKIQFYNAADTLTNLYKNARHSMSFNIFYEIPLFRNHGFVIEQSQLTPRSPYLDIELVALMYRAPVDVRHSKEFSLRIISDGNPRLGKIPTDRGYGGKLMFPFLKITQMYNEFTFKSEYAYNLGMPQWLAKIDYSLKYMHFEKLFLGRHKFAHFRIWFRDELAEYIKAILLDERTLSRPYLNRKTVEKVVISHTKGYCNYTTEISQLLTVELINRLLIEDIY